MSSNKRKEREEAFECMKPTTKLAKPTFSRADSPTAPEAVNRVSSNQLLAGYLAHEFLTKGTLFGQQWDPARAEAVPVSAELRRLKSIQKAKAEPSSKAEVQMEKYERYVEVADLFKTDGAHLPGVVNPTQLARLLQL
ncbi:uncharacterized protein LOC132306773 [Cornus florida]|uniref:uncharacterized protein LOC132306773 n=1 Tax=Cornus florida TaxID=4283 RepID=UPI002899CE47|nr:uncharacterized protein LOC132306773 [Cornus florida]